MNLRDFADDLLFYLIYIPFAIAAIVYIITGGAVGAEVMLEAAVLPWWLPFVESPPLLVLLFIALGKLGLEEYI
ncbi:hypothetical protein [Halostagnicola kamekurae]|uniref:Uncharacterized protein n=1 Tax=Halostagnicola kamekurae TaxID=619731 RepID=A0A1I6UTP2_9EURY|nr:hypothetical protein [Halostagnicola kamekurae]SFT04727.1 hypothetical protein SAMN04488556_4083 [Halostagnicola kamekurae]